MPEENRYTYEFSKRGYELALLRVDGEHAWLIRPSAGRTGSAATRVPPPTSPRRRSRCR